MRKNKIKVVIFDLCGVLVNVRWKNLDDVMHENNVKVDKDSFKRISNDVFTLHSFKTSRKAVDVFLKNWAIQKRKIKKIPIRFSGKLGKTCHPK